uniref:Putative secreted peptide n=1 Tax=Anopheles braziliensis TaxID=58242 RepID=A0A2M3ZN08_9DIPT
MLLLLLLLLLWRVQLHAMTCIARTVAHLAHGCVRIDTTVATATALAGIGNVTVAVRTTTAVRAAATSAARAVGAWLLWVLVGRRYTRWSTGCHRMTGRVTATRCVRCMRGVRHLIVQRFLHRIKRIQRVDGIAQMSERITAVEVGYRGTGSGIVTVPIIAVVVATVSYAARTTTNTTTTGWSRFLLDDGIAVRIVLWCPIVAARTHHAATGDRAHVGAHVRAHRVHVVPRRERGRSR